MTQALIPDRKDIPDDHQWDLTALFQSHADWDALFVELEQETIKLVDALHNERQGKSSGGASA